jgi:hypothetical protein
MKWFLSVCALAGLAAALSTSCGPKRDFCPSNPPDYSCFDKDGGPMGGQGGVDQGPCDGAAYMFCQDGVTKVCKVSDCPH